MFIDYNSVYIKVRNTHYFLEGFCFIHVMGGYPECEYLLKLADGNAKHKKNMQFAYSISKSKGKSSSSLSSNEWQAQIYTLFSSVY